MKLNKYLWFLLFGFILFVAIQTNVRIYTLKKELKITRDAMLKTREHLITTKNHTLSLAQIMETHLERSLDLVKVVKDSESGDSYWTPLDETEVKALSTEQGRTITYAAAYWKDGKIMKLRIRGPAIDEVRYFDGRIEKQ